MIEYNFTQNLDNNINAKILFLYLYQVKNQHARNNIEKVVEKNFIRRNNKNKYHHKLKKSKSFTKKNIHVDAY